MFVSARSSRMLVAGAALLCTASMLAGCSGSSGSSGGTTGSDGITTYPVAHRAQAPSVSGATLTGSQLSLASLRGKVVVLNVWGSWCTACREEEPALEQVYEQTKGQDVVFVGLDIEDQKATAKAFVAANQVGYASLFDPNETLMMQFAQVVPSTSVPSTVIIDKQGRIAAKAIVTVTAEQLSAVLKPIIAEPS